MTASRSLKLLFCFLLAPLFLNSSLSAETSKIPVLIGGTVSKSGAYKEPSDMIEKGYKLWVKEVNDRGGLLGRPVKLVLYDDKSDRTLTGKLYRRLIEDDKVDLVLSPYSSPLTSEASIITEEHGKLMLAVAAASVQPWQRGHRYLFQLYAPANRQFMGILDMMARKRYRTLALLYDETSPFNIDIANGIRRWAKLFKIEITLDVSFKKGKEELPDLVSKVKETDPTGLILSAYPPDSYLLFDLLKSENYKPKILSMPIVPAHPGFLKKIGSFGNNVMGPSQWEPIERIPFPGTKEFIKNFERYTGHAPSFHATSAYAACQILEQAAIQKGSLDQQKMRNHIAALDTVTVLGRFKVDPTGLQIGHNSIIIQWQNWKKEIIWPRKMRTAQPQL